MNRSAFAASRDTAPQRTAAARDDRTGGATHDDARPSTMKLAALAQIAQRTADTSDRGGLPIALRSGIEALSGVSLEGVRVHRDSSRPAQLGAHAFAQGQDIHLAPGQERHLPHEAWHIAQQAQGRVSATTTLRDGTHINDNPALEREADVMGERALATAPANDIHGRRDYAIDPERPAPSNAPASTAMQRVEFGTIGTGLGALAAFGGMAVATGGIGPLAVGAGMLGAYLGRRGGQALDHRDLKSMAGLATFQDANNGNTQGTIAFTHASNGQYYMIEQETNNNVREAAEARGIVYVRQGRRTGYHAEVRTIDWLTESAVPLSGSNMWVSKPVCADCAQALTQRGVTVKTTISEESYHNWLAPSGQSRAPVREGVEFRGRRTETERLADNWMH